MRPRSTETIYKIREQMQILLFWFLFFHSVLLRIKKIINIFKVYEDTVKNQINQINQINYNAIIKSIIDIPKVNQLIDSDLIDQLTYHQFTLEDLELLLSIVALENKQSIEMYKANDKDMVLRFVGFEIILPACIMQINKIERIKNFIILVFNKKFPLITQSGFIMFYFCIFVGSRSIVKNIHRRIAIKQSKFYIERQSLIKNTLQLMDDLTKEIRHIKPQNNQPIEQDKKTTIIEKIQKKKKKSR